MNRRNEMYTLLGLAVAVISLITACVALPQTQPFLSEALKNPLFWPSVTIIGFLILALVLILPFADLSAMAQFIRSRLPWSAPERRYLEAIISSFGKTPALLAARGRDDVRADLLLQESYSQLTLVRELVGGPEPPPPPDGGTRRRASRLIRSSDLNANTLWQRWPYRIVWAMVQLALLGVAVLMVWPLIGTPLRTTWFDWLIMLAWIAVVVVGWYLLARGLNDSGLPWLRTVLIEWRSCVAEPATPGNEIWQHQRLLILGGPGSGKTTLLRHIAFTCAHTRLGLAHRSRRDRVRDQYGWPTKPFPIYIPLRALRYAAGTNARPLIASYAHLLVEQGLLGTNMGVCDQQFFGVRLKQGGCIVLIDAFDELRSPTERGLIAKLIAELPLGPKRNLNRIVVTSRPKGYERQLDSAAFVHRQVAELTLEQAATFINQRYAGLAQLERRAGGIKPDEQLRWDVAKRAKQLVALLPVNPGLSRLSRNPLLLSLTVAIHYRQGGRELPRERHELYEKAVDLLTEEWERLRADEIGIEPTSTDGDLSLKEKKRLLAELAWSMFDRADSMSEGSHAVVLGADARASLARTLDSFAGFAPGLSGRERAMRCESEAERWLHDLSERGGILQELGNIPGSNEVEITFAHLSFQEYMASQAVGESSDQARYERLLSRWNTPAWREVLLLYAASRSDASPVVEWLLAQGSAEGELLAGATVVERPQRLRPELLNQTVRAMQAIVTGAAGLDEQAATEALAVLVDSRAAEREWLLQIIQHAPFPAVRLRALELVAGSATNGPLDEPAAEDLKAVALAVLERERNYRPRLIAGYLLARDDPRFQGDGWIPELVPIPAGAFVMGEDQEVRDGSPQRQRRLAHTVTIPYDYQIGRYPVTNAQWRRFVEAGGYTTKRYWTKAGWRWRQDLGDTWFERLRKLIPRWREPIISPETYWWDDRLWNSDNQPVVGVSWFEAVAYCRWLTETVADGRVFYLPSEAEWERAARGSDGRIYPWGNEWAADHCNSQEFGLPRTTPVGSFAEGVSVEGAYDMAGNVWEWCATTYGTSYPYTVVDEWTEAYLEEDTARRIRGGSAWNEQRAVRGAYRGFSDPRYRGYGRGLRVARRAPGTALTP